MSGTLEELRAAGLYRSLRSVQSSNGASILIDGNRYLNFSSNNYLGLATHPAVIKAACDAAKKWGAGSGASRLLSGNLAVHENLEKKIAAFKKEDAALTFSSGYLANLGVVSALVGPADVVILDRLNHASLIDATRLSGAKLWVYPHNDMVKLEALLQKAHNFRKCLVMTDAYFSMDGDAAPLPELVELCKKNNAELLIDEAHSTGIFGKEGRGMTEHFNVSGQVDVVMGTLSKALGSVGGFVAGSGELKETLINTARTFIYTTGPAPAASAAASAALTVIEKQPEIRKKLWRNAEFLREGLKALGFDLGASLGPIIPVIAGETEKALRWHEALRKERIFASLIRPPTVPSGTDRLRFSVTAEHEKTHLDELLKAMKKVRGL